MFYVIQSFPHFLLFFFFLFLLMLGLKMLLVPKSKAYILFIRKNSLQMQSSSNMKYMAFTLTLILQLLNNCLWKPFLTTTMEMEQRYVLFNTFEGEEVFYKSRCVSNSTSAKVNLLCFCICSVHRKILSSSFVINLSRPEYHCYTDSGFS